MPIVPFVKHSENRKQWWENLKFEFESTALNNDIDLDRVARSNRQGYVNGDSVQLKEPTEPEKMAGTRH